MKTPALTPVVLNVEDNEPKRYLKTRALVAAGFEVLEAPDAATARAIVRERQPDLVLLDVNLPDGNGRDLCAWIKGSKETAQVAVVQTSAMLTESSERIASLDAGADGFLVEPIEPAELIAHVRAQLRLRQAERERQAALTALQEADRRKDEFLAMLAHELRNPLAPIRNAVEILRSDDAEVRERARAIVGRQVGHLTRLVDDLLEVSRITRGKVAIQRRRVDLRSVVEAAVETMRPSIDANRHELEMLLPSEEICLDADPVRIAQAIGNLLHNAAKFTPAGGRISLTARAAGDEVEIHIADNGSGIDAELLGKVFDLFTQEDRSLARSQGGLGIGLALVRGMVELHGGSVHAESAGRGHGSRFILRLPLAHSAAEPRHAQAV